MTPNRALVCADIHTDKRELPGNDIGGIAVHIARIVAQAGAGGILVCRTLRDLVVGSGTTQRHFAQDSEEHFDNS